MRLKNKKTGEIVEWEHGLQYKLGKEYQSIKEFAEEWEDVQEPKGFWIINIIGLVEYHRTSVLTPARIEDLKEIGNYFDTEAEAEEAVRKLQAWKRLKDRGFKFTGINDDEESQYSCNQTGILCEINEEEKPTKLCRDKDFLAIFGGEE